VIRFIIIFFFDFLKKEEMRSGTHFSQQTCFFLERLIVRHGAPKGESVHLDRGGTGAGGARCCSDSPAATAAEANDADICTILQITPAAHERGLEHFSPPS
jgi:hypothetical protein